MTALRFGLSTCPNDTFLFHALLAGEVAVADVDVEWVLADVQELNEALAAGDLDGAKVSFAAALTMADDVTVLPVGSALGFGVGPVLLGRPGYPRLTPDARVLCPGAGTTAALLMRCLHPDVERVSHVRFDAIMPALARDDATDGPDAGVAIHEGRFTYEALGLPLLEDLGARWEEVTGTPVPLGGLVVRRAVEAPVVARLVDALDASLAAARADPAATLPTMRAHAQELDDDVIARHVELYVNDHTTDLGDVGRRCLDELARRSGSAGRLEIQGRHR